MIRHLLAAIICGAFLALYGATAVAQNPPPPPGPGPRPAAQSFDMEQALSDHAQETTIAFSGLAFLSGGLCADSFLPPGKVADLFGFQYLRDNAQAGSGHGTSFLGEIADNTLAVLSADQIGMLKDLAHDQVTAVNDYAWARFPLMTAFRRLAEGSAPGPLDHDAVAAWSAQIFRLDGRLCIQRAQVLAQVVASLDQEQRQRLRALINGGTDRLPHVGEQVDRRSMSHDEHVLVMTYASQLYSWLAGSTEADAYFCPERTADYFGAFYVKDAPAMGVPGYVISEQLTGDSGQSFLDLLRRDQRELITGLVDAQRQELKEIAAQRSAMAQELRVALEGREIDQEAVLDHAARWGELDGHIAARMAEAFAAVGQEMDAEQRARLEELRGIQEYPCQGAYLYSEPVAMPEIRGAGYFFGLSQEPSVVHR